MPTALITGATGGLGSAIAAALAPTHTLLRGGRPSKRLDDIARRLGGSAVALDLADTESLGSVKHYLQPETVARAIADIVAAPPDAAVSV
jgi:NADP-dependent 3-hydroxy acid dehydrogenase YdfG